MHFILLGWPEVFGISIRLGLSGTCLIFRPFLSPCHFSHWKIVIPIEVSHDLEHCTFLQQIFKVLSLSSVFRSKLLWFWPGCFSTQQYFYQSFHHSFEGYC